MGMAQRRGSWGWPACKPPLLLLAVTPAGGCPLTGLSPTKVAPGLRVLAPRAECHLARCQGALRPGWCLQELQWSQGPAQCSEQGLRCQDCLWAAQQPTAISLQP